MKAECTNGDCISTREALIEENDTLKKRIQELELQLGEKSNTKRIVQDLQSKLGTLCNGKYQQMYSQTAICNSRLFLKT